ncbi:MAG: 3-oxoacyl-[Lachnospiraceae bacterium]|nr:3-oxoacyl-[acyl-carrier-protein] reductase [Lachnospiraceae bacterium]
MLRQKTAVVTGGTRGIGFAIAKKLASQGANIAVIATRGGEAAERATETLRQTGVTAKLYLCDIRDSAAVDETAAAILQDFGAVDILVNNAGITRDNVLPGLSTADIDDVIDVDLKGAIFVTKAFVRSMMRKRSGSIINISSVVGLMGNRGQANYAAAKAGLIGFTKTVAKEYGGRGIRCNAVAPGYIATEMTAALGDEQREMLVKNLPLGRPGEPEDVADAVLFLAGDGSHYITGEVIKVDGGMYV